MMKIAIRTLIIMTVFLSWNPGYCSMCYYMYGWYQDSPQCSTLVGQKKDNYCECLKNLYYGSECVGSNATSQCFARCDTHCR